MRNAMLAATLGLLLLPPTASAQAQPAAPAAVPAQAPESQAPAVPKASAVGSKIWVGRHAEMVEFLRTAPIDRTERIPIGVTHPLKAFFAPGGPVLAAAVKHLPPGRQEGFWESYKSEIAAYEMDRLLGLDMVPVTVERRVGDSLASVQLWVENCRQLSKVDQSSCPKPDEWAKQVCRQRVFDNLVGNIDRNAGNLLIDPEWNLILIDHSRAFAANELPFEKQSTRIDRELLGRLKALDRATLDKHLLPWLMFESNVRDLLKRRDKIVAHFEALAREKGESVVFPW